MTIKEIGDFIVAEINRNLETIRQSDYESHDKFAAGRSKVLVDLLDILDECKSVPEFKSKINLTHKSALGVTSVLEELRAKIEKV